MIKRYNHKDLPKEMEECVDGYWVTYEDYNRSTLDNNKLVEKSWRARDSQQLVNEGELEKLHDTIIMLSVSLFVSVAILLFIWMRG